MASFETPASATPAPARRCSSDTRTAWTSTRRRDGRRPTGSRSPAAQTLRLTLQWAEPWFGVTTDLDAYAARRRRTASSRRAGMATRSTASAVRVPQLTNTPAPTQTVSSAIRRCTAAGGGNGTPRIKFVLIENGARRVPDRVHDLDRWRHRRADDLRPQRCREHDQHRGACRTTTAQRLEDYSSRGPVKHLLRPGERTTTRPPRSRAADAGQARHRRDRLRARTRSSAPTSAASGASAAPRPPRRTRQRSPRWCSTATRRPPSPRSRPREQDHRPPGRHVPGRKAVRRGPDRRQGGGRVRLPRVDRS